MEWLVNRDGSDRRPFVKGGASAAWSAERQWLYYQDGPMGCILKNRVDGGAPARAMSRGRARAGSRRNAVLCSGRLDEGERDLQGRARNAERTVFVTRFPASRVPLWPIGFALSPDGRWIAMPLKDRGTTNLWTIPTDGGPYRQVTDFGRRSTLIARQVSWSKDGQSIYAALAESDADIVLIEGIVSGR